MALFPNSTLRTAKTRPALVVQADQLGTALPQVILAMITSQMNRAGHPSRVVVRQQSPEGAQAGLLADSVIMTDNLATVQDTAVHRAIGSLPMSEVDDALRTTLGL